MKYNRVNVIMDTCSWDTFLFLINTGVLLPHVLRAASGKDVLIRGLDTHEWRAIIKNPDQA